MMKIPDEIDKKIITILNNNCKEGASSIGRKLGLSHTAIRIKAKTIT